MASQAFWFSVYITCPFWLIPGAVGMWTMPFLNTAMYAAFAWVFVKLQQEQPANPTSKAVLRGGLAASGAFLKSCAVQPTKQQLAFDLFGAASSAMPFMGLHVTVVRVAPSGYALTVPASELGWRHLPDGHIVPVL